MWASRTNRTVSTWRNTFDLANAQQARYKTTLDYCRGTPRTMRMMFAGALVVAVGAIFFGLRATRPSVSAAPQPSSTAIAAPAIEHTIVTYLTVTTPAVTSAPAATTARSRTRSATNATASAATSTTTPKACTYVDDAGIIKIIRDCYN